MPGAEAGAEAIRWLGFASGDLDGARANAARDDVPPRLAAFGAQQAAEKAIKALLILLETDFAKVHDLESLVLKLPTDSAVRCANVELERLSDYAVAGRYPDALEPIGRDEARGAVKAATLIFGAAIEDARRFGDIDPAQVISQ